MFVGNANLLELDPADDDNTFVLGLGARIRIRPTVYVVGEIAPRTGYKPGVNHASFGIEKRAGGHLFQLNFSNAFGTTMGQIARGGSPPALPWYTALYYGLQAILRAPQAGDPAPDAPLDDGSDSGSD